VKVSLIQEANLRAEQNKAIGKKDEEEIVVKLAGADEVHTYKKIKYLNHLESLNKIDFKF
jgi:hypothetical protein